MRKSLALIFLSVLLFSCKDQSAVEKKIEEIPVSLQLTQLDKIFFETKPENLAELKKTYPDFFPQDVPDSVWTNKMTNPLFLPFFPTPHLLSS